MVKYVVSKLANIANLWVCDWFVKQGVVNIHFIIHFRRTVWLLALMCVISVTSPEQGSSALCEHGPR
jgi:hypothetical protein